MSQRTPALPAAGSGPAGEPEDQADVVRQAVLRVPGVSALHGGAFGEVGTYLPGRRVTGIRLSEEGSEVHVVVDVSAPVRQTAAKVHKAVASLVPGVLHVFVEDVTAA